MTEDILGLLKCDGRPDGKVDEEGKVKELAEAHERVHGVRRQLEGSVPPETS